MDYVAMGPTGTKVSRLCLGCMSFGAGQDWMLSEADSIPILKRAFDAGINFFDTANVYSMGESERILGNALRQFGANRDDMVIATKVFFPMGKGPNQRGLSRKNIMASIDASLSRLGMDYVDLYQIHRFDYETPMEETLEALTDVVRAGKVRYIGASSMFSWQFAQYLSMADANGWARFVTMQNHYNLAYREEEREMIPLCQSEGIGLLPWSPLAGGFLARPDSANSARAQQPMYRDRYQRPADQAVLHALRDIAAKRGAKPAEIAIAWLLSMPNVMPILGPSKLEHLDDPLQALSIRLDDDEIAALEAPYLTQDVIGALMPD